MGSEICNPLFFDEAPHPCRETIVKSLTYEEQSEVNMNRRTQMTRCLSMVVMLRPNKSIDNLEILY